MVVSALRLLSLLVVGVAGDFNHHGHLSPNGAQSNPRLLRGVHGASSRRVTKPPLEAGLVLLRGAKETCYGSLIHEDVVLTAAQCHPHLQVNDTVVVVSVTTTLQRKIARLAPHPQFDFPYFDYMLVILDSPVENESPITISLDATMDASGEQVHLVGLAGLESSGRGTQVTTLQSLSNQACQKAYQVPIIGPLMICASSNGNSITPMPRQNGGAGSPLLDASGVQVGILSSGGDHSGSPLIFSRVAWAAEWMIQVTCSWSSSPPAALCGAAARQTTKESTYDRRSLGELQQYGRT